VIIDPDFLDHWKVRMLADLLGDEMAPIYLMRLWSHCQNRRADSFELPPPALKAICRFPGEAAALISALETAGFLVSDDNHRTMAGWREKNATLFAAWDNGSLGGRPRKPTGYQSTNPRDNPTQTDSEPVAKRLEQSRAEQSGWEQSRADQNPSAAARAAADVDFFAGLNLDAVAVKATKLKNAIPEHSRVNTSRDYIWQATVIAHQLDEGMVGEIVTRLKAGSIRNPKSYIDKALRDECEKRSLDLASLRERCPPTPPPKQLVESFAPAAVLKSVPKPAKGIRELGHNKSQVTVGS
jgi:hypothetical protein